MSSIQATTGLTELLRCEREVAELLGQGSRDRIFFSADPELRKVITGVLDQLHALRARYSNWPNGLDERIATLLRHSARDWTVDSAWRVSDALDGILLETDAPADVEVRVMKEAQREALDEVGRWSYHLPAPALADLVVQTSAAASDRSAGIDRARTLLRHVYAGRSAVARHRSARLQVRERYLRIFSRTLAVLLVACLTAVGVVGGVDHFRNFVLAAFVGALGSALSGVLKLRDDVVGMPALKSFAPAMYTQPFVGATAAMFMVLLLHSPLWDVDGSGGGTPAGALQWTALGVYCFLAGFSEPFFLGSVRRVTQTADRSADDKPAPDTTPGAAGGAGGNGSAGGGGA